MRTIAAGLILLAACGSEAPEDPPQQKKEKPKREKRPTPPGETLIPLEALKQLEGFSALTAVDYVRMRKPTAIYKLRRGDAATLFGRITVEAKWEAQDAWEALRTERAKIERDKPGQGEGLHRVADRVDPTKGAYILVEDVPRITFDAQGRPRPPRDKDRKRLAQIGFIREKEKLLVRVILFDTERIALAVLEQRAARLAHWVNKKLVEWHRKAAEGAP